MIRVFIIPLLAIAGVVFAAYTVVNGAKPPVAQPPVIPPPKAPFDAFVAGSGLVESSSQNIAIGSPVGDIVARVAVRVGDHVEAGAVLFELDARSQNAELAIRERAVDVAERTLAKLHLGTRPEMIPPARARVSEARAVLADAQSQLARWDGVADQRARSEDEVSQRRFAVESAKARLAAAEADLALLEAGTWAPDLVVAQSQLEQAKAQAQSTRTEIERRVVRAPITGRVLQVNVRAGEFAQAGALATPLMMMGSIRPLHVRVDVDENDAWRVREGAKAVAFARGNRDISTPLEFLWFEPFVVPKRSLTGDSTERVDTRVLQVLYRVPANDLPIFVGQQVDVFIESTPIDRRALEGEP